MKKCYINPQIIIVPIHPRPTMVDSSEVKEEEYSGWGDDAKGFYGSWEADDEDE